MNRLLIAAALAGALAGCENINTRMDDGYQFGDLTGTALDGTVHALTIQQQYCTESDPVARAVLLRLIRTALPGYPSDGLCTDVLSAMEDTHEVP
ncbi:hypothetical protein H9C73_02850 [Marinobacterium sp. AK62]|uniref:Lipoprotein n=1 Tax=Marinobacterium alkalitolerans TaxID=1542925 RepID=A0ABS3Z7H4_9GAMM|nr:hypothetical protein [Marinobacterium alkalitolerans]MBP0047663.1 hypothetical protein [Marinobacterium alkalitolerans]